MLLLASLLSVSAPVTTAAGGNGDWPQFHSGPEHAGLNAAETTISATNVHSLIRAWQGSTGSLIEGGPVIADGVVYVGSTDGKLYAFAVNCAEGGGDCSPIWTATTGQDFEWPDGITTSPAVADGVVYAISGNGGSDSRLYAFAVGCSSGGGSCNPLWTAGLPGGHSSPTVADGVVYVAGESEVLAFTAACAGDRGVCAPLWTAHTSGGIAGSPTVTNGVVYVAAGALYAYRVGCAVGGASCDPLWTSQDVGLTTTPAVADGVVYAGSSQDGGLYAFSAGCATGCGPAWVGWTDGRIFAAPAVADGVVYVGSDDTKLYAFPVGCSAGGGSCNPLWTAKTNGYVESSPAVANGVVYVGSADHHLYAFPTGCATGGGCPPLWTATTGDLITAAPAVSNGKVYVGGWDGNLYAYGLETPADHLVLSPASAEATAGAMQPFKAEGFDDQGHDLGDFTQVATFAIVDGACTGATCWASAVGGHLVSATAGAASGTARLQVVPQDACPTVVSVAATASLEPIAEAARNGFETGVGAGCALSIPPATSDVALSYLEVGHVQAALISRPLTDAESPSLYGWQIASDAMVFAVQDSKTMSFLSGLTRGEVWAIYSGYVRGWKDLGGPDEPILVGSGVIDSDARADLLRTFGISDTDEQRVVGDRFASPVEAAAAAKANPYEIVFTSLHEAEAGGSGLKVLSLDGVTPSVSSVQNGTYPAIRTFWVVMRADQLSSSTATNSSTVKAQDFVNFMFTAAGQQLVAQANLVDVEIPATPPIPDFDINLDGAIGLADLGGVTGHWSQTSPCPGWIRADVNNDGAVGLADLGKVTARWGQAGFVAPQPPSISPIPTPTPWPLPTQTPAPYPTPNPTPSGGTDPYRTTLVIPPSERSRWVDRRGTVESLVFNDVMEMMSSDGGSSAVIEQDQAVQIASAFLAERGISTDGLDLTVEAHH
jgi:outer membrane protein assembly factor BamB/ABC-type phosphate transport system substrate-binding protein